MKKLLLIILVVLLMPTIALAHSGGTDANGGHHDYNNVSGLGSYHYHHGYGPHLHPGGVCPYDYTVDNSGGSYDSGGGSTETYSYPDSGSSSPTEAPSTSTYVAPVEESYTMTESELQDYVLQKVQDDPEYYDMVRLEDYEELQKDYESLKKNTIDKSESTEDILIAVAFTAIAGGLACYIVYKKLS